MLKTSTGAITVAKDGESIVGVMQVVTSDRCQPGMRSRLRMMPSMVRILGRSFPASFRWFGAWGRHDPSQAHEDLGPIGVLPNRQGQGVGPTLLKAHVDALDQPRKPGYLETDKAINVRLYERFGYRVVEELPVLGVQTWLMWREPAR